MSTARRRRAGYARRLSWLVVAAMVAAGLAPMPALAAEIAPNAASIELVAGNPTCADNQYFDFKIDEAPSDGTYNGIILSNVTSTSFDWAMTDEAATKWFIDAVIVKGGDNALVYFYDDPSVQGDTNLQSPTNAGGQQAEISHVEFCFDKKDHPEETEPPTDAPPTDTPPTDAPPTDTPPTDAPPTDTPPTDAPPTDTPPTDAPPTDTPPTEPPGGGVLPTATPAGGVAGSTGTPNVTLPPTDTLGTATSAPAGEGWRVILLAMAGVLAGALLLTPASTVVARKDDRQD